MYMQQNIIERFPKAQSTCTDPDRFLLLLGQTQCAGNISVCKLFCCMALICSQQFRCVKSQFLNIVFRSLRAVLKQTQILLLAFHSYKLHERKGERHEEKSVLKVEIGFTKVAGCPKVQRSLGRDFQKPLSEQCAVSH